MTIDGNIWALAFWVAVFIVTVLPGYYLVGAVFDSHIDRPCRRDNRCDPRVDMCRPCMRQFARLLCRED